MKTPKFIDEKNREWSVKFDYALIKKVRESDIDFDLATLMADDMAGFRKLMTDVVLFIDVLFVAVSDQHRVTEEDFAEGMAGQALQDAMDAFIDSMASFYPSRQGEMLRALVTKEKELSDVLSQTVQTASLQEMISGELDSRLEQLLGSQNGSSIPTASLSGQRQK